MQIDSGTLISAGALLIAALTFAASTTTRAKQDGQLTEKLNNCVSGIDDIKRTTAGIAEQQTQNQMALTRMGVRMDEYERRQAKVEERLDDICNHKAER